MGYVLPDVNSNLLLSLIFDIFVILNDRTLIQQILEKASSSDMNGWGRIGIRQASTDRSD